MKSCPKKPDVNGLPFDTLTTWQHMTIRSTKITKELILEKDGKFAVCNLELRTDTSTIENARVRFVIFWYFNCKLLKWKL